MGQRAMLGVLASTLLSGLLWAGQDEAVDVCRAARRHGGVAVRGTGQMLDEGLVLASLACPVAKTGDDRIPTMLLVKVERFASEAVRQRFQAALAHPGQYSPALEIEVRGTVRCRSRMRWIRSGEDIVGGAGFGVFGLYKCLLEAGELLRMEEAAGQPEGRGVMIRR